MPLYKNVASQKLSVYAYYGSTNAPATGQAANISAYISKDGAAAAATNDAAPTELDATNMKGIYLFDLAQAETNANMLDVSPVCSTDDVLLDPVHVYTESASDILYGVELANFPFVMYLSSDGKTPATGKTIVVEARQDADATFTTCTNSPATEIENGSYIITLTAAEMTGSFIEVQFSEGTCITYSVVFKTSLS